MKTDKERRLPGEPGVWVLILGDLLVFAIFFCLFAKYRAAEPVVFAVGAASLDKAAGLANTIALLTSSLFVAIGVHRKVADRAGAPRMFGLAAALGGLFVLLKAYEYTSKFSHGISFSTNNFYMLYFSFTAIHLLHVLIGLAALMAMRSMAAEPFTTERMILIESGASFWHLVDILWIVLFALLYLAG